jgi:hypothetical protein
MQSDLYVINVLIVHTSYVFRFTYDDTLTYVQY